MVSIYITTRIVVYMYLTIGSQRLPILVYCIAGVTNAVPAGTMIPAKVCYGTRVVLLKLQSVSSDRKSPFSFYVLNHFPGGETPDPHLNHVPTFLIAEPLPK
jgi:hypothetical protein